MSHDGLIRRFDAASGQPLAPANDSRRSDFIYSEGVAFALHGERAAVWDHIQVLLQDSATGKRIARIPFPAGCARVTLSADGRTLVVVDGNNGFWFIDAATC